MERSRKELELLLRSAAKRIKREKSFYAALVGGELKEEKGSLKEQLLEAAKEGLPVEIKKK